MPIETTCPTCLTQQHLGYAVQWFAMAAALVVLYVVLNVRKARRGPVDEPIEK